MTGARTLLVHRNDGVERTTGVLEDVECWVTAVGFTTRALAALLTEEFDCLVSEHSLPGDDRLSLLTATRDIEPGVPFALYADPSLADDAFENGVDRFVTKNGADSAGEFAAEVDNRSRSRPGRVRSRASARGYRPCDRRRTPSGSA
jgi:HTH-type transcriptional regulator, bacterioopsin transcriptional activator and related proteins